MEKNTLLEELRTKVRTGELTYEEVTAVFNAQQTTVRDGDKPSMRKLGIHFTVTNVLYTIGVVIVLCGISFLVAQIWDDLGSAGRILITLGTGILLAVIGSALLLKKPKEMIGAIFHLLGGALIPGGAMVTLNEFTVVEIWPTTIVFFAISIFYALLTHRHKHPLLTFFTVLYSTVTLYLFSEALLDPVGDFYAYLTMAIGLGYLLMAQNTESWNRPLVNIFRFFGALGFLGALYSEIRDHLFFEIFFFAVLFAFLSLAIKLRSTLVLGITTLFVIIHVGYITFEYFADSLGWPLSLVLLGFVFIGLGYASIKLNKEYIHTPSSSVS